MSRRTSPWLRRCATAGALAACAAFMAGGAAWAHDEGDGGGGGESKRPRPPKLSLAMAADASEEALADHFGADDVTFQDMTCKRRTRSRGWCRATLTTDGEQYRAKTRVRSFWNEDDERDAWADVLWARSTSDDGDDEGTSGEHGGAGGHEPPPPAPEPQK